MKTIESATSTIPSGTEVVLLKKPNQWNMRGHGGFVPEMEKLSAGAKGAIDSEWSPNMEFVHVKFPELDMQTYAYNPRLFGLTSFSEEQGGRSAVEMLEAVKKLLPIDVSYLSESQRLLLGKAMDALGYAVTIAASVTQAIEEGSWSGFTVITNSGGSSGGINMDSEGKFEVDEMTTIVNFAGLLTFVENAPELKRVKRGVNIGIKIGAYEVSNLYGSDIITVGCNPFRKKELKCLSSLLGSYTRIRGIQVDADGKDGLELITSDLIDQILEACEQKFIKR